MAVISLVAVVSLVGYLGIVGVGECDGVVETVEMAGEDKVVGEGGGGYGDVLFQDEIVAVVLSTLAGLSEHLDPSVAAYVLGILVLSIALIQVTVGDVIVGVLHIGIGALPPAAGEGERVAVLVVHSVVIFVADGLQPQLAAGALIVDALTADVQVDHRLVVGIEVEDELLVVLQAVAERYLEVNLVLVVEQGILGSGIVCPLLIVHHTAAQRVSGTHDEVVDRHLAIDCALIFHAVDSRCFLGRAFRGNGAEAFAQGGPFGIGGIDVGFFLRVVIGNEMVCVLDRVRRGRVVVAAALAHEMRYGLAHDVPLRGVGMVLRCLVVAVFHSGQYIYIAEAYVGGGGVVLAATERIAVDGDVVAHVGIYQDIGQHACQTVSEGQLHTGHGGIERKAGRHAQIACEQGVVAQ